MLKRIACWIILSLSITSASNLQFTISELSGLRIDYEDNKFIESKDGFSQMSIFINENANGDYIYTDNKLKIDKKCMVAQKTSDYIAFLLDYPEAIWTITVFPNQNIAYISVQRVLINANALLMHGRLKTIIK